MTKTNLIAELTDLTIAIQTILDLSLQLPGGPGRDLLRRAKARLDAQVTVACIRLAAPEAVPAPAPAAPAFDTATWSGQPIRYRRFEAAKLGHGETVIIRSSDYPDGKGGMLYVAIRNGAVIAVQAKAHNAFANTCHGPFQDDNMSFLFADYIREGGETVYYFPYTGAAL